MKILLAVFTFISLSAQAAQECTKNQLFCFGEQVIDLKTSSYLHRATVVKINPDDSVKIQFSIDAEVYVVTRQQNELAITQRDYCPEQICVGSKVAPNKPDQDLEDESIYSVVEGITPGGIYVLLSDTFPLNDRPVDVWVFTYSKRQDLIP